MTEEMDDPLDRDLQRRVLVELQKRYPGGAFLRDLFPEVNEGILVANVCYLAEHGLCADGVERIMSGIFPGRGTITARGLDFLADDGGLSAILGVVTVKLDGETIRDLVAAKIEGSNFTAEHKSALRKGLASLGATALRELTQQLIRLGLERLPEATQLLGRLHGL